MDHSAFERTIPEQVQWIVLERDNYQCQICGTSGDNRLHLHHWKHFRSQGGEHTPENLVTVCWICHKDIHDYRVTISLYLVDGIWRSFWSPM